MPFRRGGLDRDTYMLRGLGDEVRRGRTKRSVTVGPWVLDVDRATGNLMATHVPTGTVRTLVALDEPCPPGHPAPEPLTRGSQPPPVSPPVAGEPTMCLLDHDCGPDCPPRPGAEGDDLAT